MDYATQICLAVGVISTLYALARFLGPARDAQEPYYIDSKVPLIGHLIHLMREGAWYFSTLDKKYHHGIYTLPILNGKMYVAASPSAAQAVQRNYKTIAFTSLVIPFLETLFLIDKPSIAVLSINPNGLEGTHGFATPLHDLMVNALAPGPRLDDLNKAIQKSLLPRTARLVKSTTPQKVELWTWLRHEFSLASIEALYGPNHPFLADESLVSDFWEFEKGMTGLIFSPLPWLTARSAYMARKRMLEVLVKYTVGTTSIENDKEASALIQARNVLSREHGITEIGIGRGELSLIFAALVNTTSAAFWLIVQIFASPALLSSIRAEIDACCTTSAADQQRIAISTKKLRTACPLFLSTAREILRIAAPVHVSRQVLEDTLIPNAGTGRTVLLKKGNVIQTVTSVLHTKEQTWGSDAQDFNPRRFLSPPSADPEKTTGDISRPVLPLRVDRAAYRPFGSGIHLCPGRHFAQVEIMTLAALLVVGYDMTAENGRAIKPPPFEKTPSMGAVVKPLGDVEAYVCKRPGFENTQWEMEL